MKPVEATMATKSVRHQESVLQPGSSAVRTPGSRETDPRVAPEQGELLRQILCDLGVTDKDLTKVDLRYSIHKDSGRPMMVIRNRATLEILHTVPPEELLNLVARIMEYVGLLVDETA